MNTKTKVTTGVTFLFLLIIAMGITSIYFIRSLSGSTDRLIEDNQQSIDYVEHMKDEIDHAQYYTMYGLTKGIISTGNHTKTALAESMLSDFNKNLDSEAKNITEIGEAGAVKKLQSDFSAYKAGFDQLINGNNDPNNILEPYRNLLSDLSNIYELNKQAILEKNSSESKTASKGVYYVTLVGSVFILVAFVFILSFPGKIAG